MMTGEGGKTAGALSCSLYIHVPFCAALCDYCDFYSIRISPGDERINRYIDILLGDAEKGLRSLGTEKVPTVYIGGGTPSLLGAAGVGRLLRGLNTCLPRGLRDVAEITLEANPESADEAFLRACRDGGITRISLGIQSFHRASRGAVHRAGSERALLRGLALAAEYYGGDLSVDLITGLPFQDEYVLLGDIERALSYGPGHVSLYALTAEPGTPLKVPALPPPEEADRLWIRGRNALEDAGYAQYEVSNFSRPGKGSLHNIRYWRMENWLGIGPAASGTIIEDETGRGRRFTIPGDVEAYLRGEAPAVREELDRLTLLKETLLMGFRYIEGPDEALFARRFHCSVPECIPKTIRAWREKGLFRREKNALTREGLLFLNAFLIDAFVETDALVPVG
ncbi:MAG: radical SAM family heme chaperone HemW [Treponema sp.]|jgi:oxygen-independent coproporphyrinogen-3 oxidase|nr:radical SAM family heme chaperone HemW [Treponema sp.]